MSERANKINIIADHPQYIQNTEHGYVDLSLQEINQNQDEIESCYIGNLLELISRNEIESFLSRILSISDSFIIHQNNDQLLASLYSKGGITSQDYQNLICQKNIWNIADLKSLLSKFNLNIKQLSFANNRIYMVLNK